MSMVGRAKGGAESLGEHGLAESLLLVWSDAALLWLEKKSLHWQLLGVCGERSTGDQQ
jgi:hypothetical protein